MNTPLTLRSIGGVVVKMYRVELCVHFKGNPYAT